MRTLADNAGLQAEGRRARSASRSSSSASTIGDGVELDGWLIKPPDFDPAKTYPLLFHVYGEPAGQTVLDRWGGSNYLWHLMLAQQGYMVASVDNRGTPAPRGRDWRKSIYRQIGILASAGPGGGRRAAIREVAVRRSRARRHLGLERRRVDDAQRCCSVIPDLYTTGMSVAPVPDQRLYDTIYQERYMGLPAGQRRGLQARLADHLRRRS